MVRLRRFLLALLIVGALAQLSRAEPPPASADRSAAVGVDTGPLLVGTRVLAMVLGGIAALFGVLLYVVPARAVAATKRSVEAVMTERALTLQEEDRRRIARELHDGAGQALTAARLQLVALEETVGDARAIGRIVQHIDEAIDEVRRSTSALAPPALAELGLAGALERHCEVFSLASNLPVRCDVTGSLPPLEAYVETACYRIAQEALHNAARHAGAKRAWLRLAATDRELSLEIGDDGAGITDPSKLGFGLDSIRERARLVGATVRLLSEAGRGARLILMVPIGRMA